MVVVGLGSRSQLIRFWVLFCLCFLFRSGFGGFEADWGFLGTGFCRSFWGFSSFVGGVGGLGCISDGLDARWQFAEEQGNGGFRWWFLKLRGHGLAVKVTQRQLWVV